MAVPAEALQRCEIFDSLAPWQVEPFAQIAQVVSRPPGDTILDGRHKPDGVYVIKSGIVALFLRVARDRVLPLEVLGPGRVLDCRTLAEEAEALLVARAVMRCELYRIPIARLRKGPMRDAETAATVSAQVKSAQRARLSNALAALDAFDIDSPDQPCPVGRPASFTPMMNTSTGVLLAACQRDFTCTTSQGGACPLAGLPAKQAHPIWRPLQTECDSPSIRPKPVAEPLPACVSLGSTR